MNGGLLELGEIMVSGAQRRLELVSQNVSNLTTPGYRKGVSFENSLAHQAHGAELVVSTDFTPGSQRITGQPFDLALSSVGFFRVRGEDTVYYTRAGQFTRDAEGRLVDAQGLALQTADGQDLIVRGNNAEILADGAVLEAGVPIARVGVFEAAPDAALSRMGGAYFVMADNGAREVASPLVRQGALEASNVDLPAEMLTMMSALRQAEVGARVVQTYDALIGQTITTLGRVQA